MIEFNDFNGLIARLGNFPTIVSHREIWRLPNHRQAPAGRSHRYPRGSILYQSLASLSQRAPLVNIGMQCRALALCTVCDPDRHICHGGNELPRKTTCGTPEYFSGKLVLYIETPETSEGARVRGYADGHCTARAGPTSTPGFCLGAEPRRGRPPTTTRIRLPQAAKNALQRVVPATTYIWILP